MKVREVAFNNVYLEPNKTSISKIGSQRHTPHLILNQSNDLKTRKSVRFLAVFLIFTPTLFAEDITLDSFVQSAPGATETSISLKLDANLPDQFEIHEAINITDGSKKALDSNYRTTISVDKATFDDNSVDENFTQSNEDMTVIEQSTGSTQLPTNTAFKSGNPSNIEETYPSSLVDLPIESDIRYHYRKKDLQSEQNRMDRLLDILLNNGSITEQQRYLLLKSLDDFAPAVKSNPLPAKKVLEVEIDDANSENPTGFQDGLPLPAVDKDFSLAIGGRLMWDLAHYQQDQALLGNGTELRRGSVELGGRFFTDWEYKYSIDFSGSDVDIGSASLAYKAIPNSELRLGQFKEPFSLENQTSSKYITFMERSLIDNFAPGYHLGVGLHSRGKQWSTAVGLFSGAVDDDVDDEGDEGWSVTGRVTYIPRHQDNNVVHLGIALSHRSTDDKNEVKFNARPESHITDIKYLNTGPISDVSKVSLHGVELALVRGPFSMQSEYLRSKLDRDSANNLGFSGWYIYGSWFITGESRTYKPKKGIFGRVKPMLDTGAWELAIRYSKMDLSDSDIRGGIGDQTTLGVNWYVNSHMRIMANYAVVDNDENADDNGDVSGDDDPEIFQIRTQIDF